MTISKNIQFQRDDIVVCTDLSGRAPHRHVGGAGVVTTRILGGVIVSTLAQNARDVGSIPTLGVIFHFFYHLYDNTKAVFLRFRQLSFTFPHDC